MAKTIAVGFDSAYDVEIIKIRNAVFSKEQNIDVRADFDGRDAEAIHALVESGGQYIGTGRMLPDGHIGRLAMIKSERGKGLGKRIMLTLIEEARKQGLQRVYLGAQKHAIGFYKGLGFVEFGEPYVEVGIEHVLMEKILSAPP